MNKVTELLDEFTLIAKENNLNNIQEINQLINLYINGDEVEGCSSTVLGLAAYRGNSFLVEELLKNGANPNIPSCGYKQKFMPIHMTIWGAQSSTNVSERIEIIKLLNKYHADLHWKGNDQYSWSPLATADVYSYPLGAQLLMLGVNPRAPSSARQIEKVTDINKSIIFVELACEEAKAKYESSNQGYKLPSKLHQDLLTPLLDLKFQYNPDSSLLSVTIERFDANEKKYTWTEFCSGEVQPKHTDIFDLSEVMSRSIPFYCREEYLPISSSVARYYSDEAKECTKAVYELLCSYDTYYGTGMTLCLQIEEDLCKSVTIKGPIGQGQFKQATLLTNGQVIMLPNLEIGEFQHKAQFWPELITKEAEITNFVTSIGVPVLNRKKAYLIVPSKENKETLYKLPVLISDSFQQYKLKKWFIIDTKNRESSTFSDKELAYWKSDLTIWKEPIKPLIRDLLVLEFNNVKFDMDSRNLVLIEKETGVIELRYFGFDFQEASIPSEETRPQLKIEFTTKICQAVLRHAAHLIHGFIFDRHLNQFMDEVRLENHYEISNEIINNFFTCEQIKQIALGLDSSLNSQEL